MQQIRNVANYIKQKIKAKKKGLSAIETCMGTLIFIIAFVDICDFLIISNRYLSLTDTTKELARTLSVQGGSLTLKPGAYTSNYYNIEELAYNVKKQMNGMGFKDGEYDVYLTYTKIFDDAANASINVSGSEKIIGTKPDGTYGVVKETQKIEYLSDFSVSITARYDWPFINSVIRRDPSYITVSMPGVSEWRYGFDGWESET